MKVEWHCRECNEKGEQEISVKDFNENKETVLSYLISKIKHKCNDLSKQPQIGIRNIP